MVLKTTTAFEVETEAFHYVHASGIYNSFIRAKRLQSMSVAKCVIHFLQKGFPVSEMPRRVDYMGVQDVVSAHCVLTNVARIVQWAPVNELVYGN